MSITPLSDAVASATNDTDRLFAQLRHCDRAEAEMFTLAEHEASTLDLDQCDKDGNTLLHSAIIAHATQIARMLIARGAPVDAANKHGMTPLHMAATQNNKALALDLLAAGCATDKQNHIGNTALHYFASVHFQNLDQTVIDALIAAPDFNPNIANRRGEWSTEIAARDGGYNLFWDLVAQGAYVPASTADFSSSLKNHLAQAQQRLDQFIAHPDIASLTHEDMLSFANLGKLHHVFHPSIWQSPQTPSPLDLLDALPPFLVQELLTQEPWLSEKIAAASPASTISTPTVVESRAAVPHSRTPT